MKKKFNCAFHIEMRCIENVSFDFLKLFVIISTSKSRLLRHSVYISVIFYNLLSRYNFSVEIHSTLKFFTVRNFRSTPFRFANPVLLFVNINEFPLAPTPGSALQTTANLHLELTKKNNSAFAQNFQRFRESLA